MAASGAPAARASLESGAFTFHYIIDNDVCFLTLVEKSYPKKLAYQYLEELQREFFSLYGREIEQARRPYAFIKFGKKPKIEHNDHISKYRSDYSSVKYRSLSMLSLYPDHQHPFV